ncbi:GDP-L-fucose synthase family protein [Paenibacillus sp. Soil787]|uniref:GDP-L-fucose synthase family protein n=1 Tax=Paenibacillus sp. Soil787 TaxID=1736411 RepID=UPI00070394D5|nr:GDP-L-fucose synthase [Paenibacillus sp. Soil787]KRF18685.1 GDP-fucose synthetase [Paenibacillus sp. Soil787]
MDTDSIVFVAGHRGLVGSAIVRKLKSLGYSRILTKTRNELDLTDSKQVERFFEENRPQYVFLSAAKVGGIYANSKYPADFIRENLAIQTNVIHASYRFQTKKLLFLGSSCIYPKMAPQPLLEDYLLSGKLESTNEPYAIAKIAGIKMCEAYNAQYDTNFMAVMPTNLYGPHDNFDLQHSHVLPALIRKFHQAKVSGQNHVLVWGTGMPRREFLHVDDLADACVYLMDKFDVKTIGPFVNIGTGDDLTIRELAELIGQTVGFVGDIVFDETKPDGTPRKVLDVSKINRLGWQASIGLKEGIEETYQWFQDHYDQ